MSEDRWARAVTLVCPFTRFESSFRWLTAEETDPCPQKKCGLPQCHNYGKSFADGELVFIPVTR